MPFDLARSFESVFRTSAEERPVVVIFDDLQAADEASVELLHLLVRSTRGVGVVFLCSYRGDPDAPSSERLAKLVKDAKRIELRGFDEGSVRELYESMTNAPCSDDLARELLEATEGNPLYLKEAIASAQGGTLHRPDHSIGFRVPAGLKGLLRLRLTALSEEVLKVLAIASAVGRRFDLRLLAEVHGADAGRLAQLLDDPLRAGVVREIGGQGEYEFSQVLLRELLYEELRSSERMRLHAAIADALTRRYGPVQDDHLAEIAHHHFKAAQATDQKKTLDLLVRAGGEARSRGAVAEATRNYQRALKVAELQGAARSKRDSIKDALRSLSEPNAVAGMPRAGSEPEVAEHDLLRRDGDYWTMSYNGRVMRLKDSKGVGYLRQLLAAAGRELHVLDMAATAAGTDPARPRISAAQRRESGLEGSTSGTGEALLDTRAKEEFRKRIDDLQEEIDDAESMNDPERGHRAKVEMEHLIDALTSATGVGGRDRTVSLEAERARLSVSKALRGVISKIAEHDRALGEHLNATVRTGYYCSYTPDPRAARTWKLDA